MTKSNVNLAGRALALASVAPAAMAEGLSRADVVKAIKAAYSKRTHDKVRTEYMAGRIAASLRRPMDNRTDVQQLIEARLILTMANAGGTGKLKKGQSRRTKEQELACGAARTAWSSILTAAGLKTVEKRGGARNGVKKGQGKAKAAPKAANDVSPAKAAPKMNKPADVSDYVLRQSAILDAFARKNAALLSGDVASAITALYAAARKSEG